MKVKINLKVREVDDKIKITISDNGVGMDEETKIAFNY